MSSVYFDPTVGGDGSTVTDDSNPATGLANGGHRTRFVPALAQVVAVAQDVVANALDALANAQSALASAQSAIAAPGTSATSTTSVAIGTGSKAFTIQTGKNFVVGQYVVVASTANVTNNMIGQITAHDSGTGALTVSVGTTGGSGTFASWSIGLCAPGDVTTTGTQTLTNKTALGLILNDGYTEEVFTVSGTTPALSPTNGSVQTWTLTANSTPTAGTWASGQSITLMIDDGTSYAITWTSLGVVWRTGKGSAPTLAASGLTAIALWKVGTTIFGARVGDA